MSDAQVPVCSPARFHALRLPPGADLKTALTAAASAAGLQAAFVASCVGSLAAARLRMPSLAGEADAVVAWVEPLEILSLCGTLSPTGAHLHVALSRRDGSCIRGHLLAGCPVRTTAELVLGELVEACFSRTPDPATGFHELEVRPRAPATGSGADDLA